MRRVVLFIAASVDGYIADQNGGVDWLTGQGAEEEVDTYADFAKTIDTVIMGRTTYNQIVTELSPDEWVYQDLTTYVVTHKKQPSSEKIIFSDQDPAKLVKKLQRQAGKDIWICGGAQLAQQLMQAGLIDRYYLSVIPTILGQGVRLFGDLAKAQRLKLIRTAHYDGIVELVYDKR